MYKGPDDRITRALRRLWEVEIYEGDPDAKTPKTRTETVIAWNAVDAVRFCGGKAASPPVAKDFVTWDEPPRIIRSTAGPEKATAKPTIAPPAEEDWDHPVLNNDLEDK